MLNKAEWRHGGQRNCTQRGMEREDRRPGNARRIERDDDAVTFTLRVATAYGDPAIELVIRCERNGEMFASLRPAKRD